MERGFGILAHISSLDSNYNIGTMGISAYRFVDFLHKCGASYWQVLPLGPTGYGDSPYQSLCAFAGNPYLIDLDTLRDDGLLTSEELSLAYSSESDYQVNYSLLYKTREPLLRLAYQRAANLPNKQFDDFISTCSKTLHEYALYMSLKVRFKMAPWYQWADESLRLRNPSALEECRISLHNEINFWLYVQFLFRSQWLKLKRYANSLGISIIGDMPIYVGLDSTETWINPDIFWLDCDKNPVCVAGCPPDKFSLQGQLWGNPLYDWSYLKRTGYRWWLDRLTCDTQLFDIVRIDHFRGFDSFYAIPFGAKNAVNGSWQPGPGIDFFRTINCEFPNINIIAEDLGFLTPSVQKLLQETSFPGMNVLQFAFDNPDKTLSANLSTNRYLPHNYQKNSVVYTGTHDNDTTAGWYSSLPPQTKEYLRRYTHMLPDEDPPWALIRTAFASISRIAMFPMQDFLSLDSHSRMNTPSSFGQNWQWRIQAGALTENLAQKIHNLGALYGRIN